MEAERLSGFVRRRRTFWYVFVKICAMEVATMAHTANTRPARLSERSYTVA